MSASASASARASASASACVCHRACANVCGRAAVQSSSSSSVLLVALLLASFLAAGQARLKQAGSPDSIAGIEQPEHRQRWSQAAAGTTAAKRQEAAKMLTCVKACGPSGAVARLGDTARAKALLFNTLAACDQMAETFSQAEGAYSNHARTHYHLQDLSLTRWRQLACHGGGAP